jgi:alpha-N-acetylglucosamine transferase
MAVVTKKLEYELRKFTSPTLGDTQKEWDRQIAKDPDEILRSQYDRIFSWAAGHIDYGNHQLDTFAYGLFHDGKHQADAIVEVSYAKAGRKWLKMLDLHLSPELDAAFYDQTVDLSRMSQLFTAAIFGVLHLTDTAHRADTVKLYGRSGTLLSFLKGVATYINDRSKTPGLTVAIEGRWLVFRR